MPDETISHGLYPYQGGPGSPIVHLIVWGRWMADTCKVIAYSGSAVGVTGGLLAQASNLTGTAGLWIGLTGVVTALGAIITSVVNSYYQDKKDARENDKLKQRVAELEGELGRLTELEGRVDKAEEKTVINAAHGAMTQVKADTAHRVLQDMGKIPPQDVPKTQTRLRTTLLIAEDEVQAILALGRWFDKRGYDIVSAATVEEALGMFDQPGRDPHWAIVDLRMPGEGDGLDILRKIRQEGKQTKVIVCTGFKNEEKEKEALELGAIAVEEKPANPDRLWQIMAQEDERGRAAMGP